MKLVTHSSKIAFGYPPKIIKYCCNPRSVGISQDKVLAIVSIATAISWLLALLILSSHIGIKSFISLSMLLEAEKSGLFCLCLIS